MTGLADAVARKRIATEFGTTFFVEAAAGTGKTTALVGRIVELVRTGAGTLGQIVAVTFTEKAAGEMKLRLRGEIEKARLKAASEERTRLDRALNELELARIGTIHAFCGDLLHERPIESGIDPLFEVLSESGTRAIAEEAFDGWFQNTLSDPPEGVRRVLRRRSGKQLPRELLRNGMLSLLEHRDFPARWRRDPFDRDAAIDKLIDGLTQLGALASASSWSSDRLAQNLAEIARAMEELTRLEAVHGRDYDGLEAGLRTLSRRRSWEWKGAAKTKFGARSRDEVLVVRDRLKADLAGFIEQSDADLAPLIHEALQAPIANYQALKAKAGRLDFLDLLIKTRDLVRGDRSVRVELQRRFTHFFIDEFQDTDPLQTEILLLLAADKPDETDWRATRPVPGKLFLVGDPKQSIYRFRRADVALYEGIKDHLVAIGAEVLHLTTSFRAQPSIQTFVNEVFSGAMSSRPDGGQAAYVALQHARPEFAGQPSLIALPVPRPYGDFGNIIERSINESLPDAVGGLVAWLVNSSGWTVEEEGRRVPIRPRHIAILFRRFRNFGADVTRPYVRALEARNVPHVLVGSRSFHDREEVIALRNAIDAIEWPDDELKVFATLRGPFFALNDEALLAFRQHIGDDGAVRTRRLNPMHQVERATLDPIALDVADALDVLRQLHFDRNRIPIAATVAKFLGAVRAHAGIALWPTGEQALANCQRLIDIARRFERGASSFRAFAEELGDDMESAELDEAPIVEESTEGVRVLTVHKAKGLEFQVVILADPTCNETRDTPSRHVDPSRSLWVETLCGCVPAELKEAAQFELQADRAEAVRVAYVAATRARDLLVAPVCGDQPIEGWLSVLDTMLYPAIDARRAADYAPGCPAFGEDSVLERGPKGQAPGSGTVRPGLHRPKIGGPPVVWWDPAALPLEMEEQSALRYQRLLERDPDGIAAAASEQSYSAWKQGREALIATSSKPSLSVQTVTQRALAGGKPSHAVSVEVMKRSAADRPGGSRFGTLVHAVLAAIDLDGDTDSIRASAALCGRLVGATDEEVEAAVVLVGSAVQHPILRRAAESGRAGGLRRETPMLIKLPDESLVEGVIDLAFREETPEFSGWTIVDFKTDREFAGSTDRYVAQVQLYSDAVAKATSASVRGIVLVL